MTSGLVTRGGDMVNLAPTACKLTGLLCGQEGKVVPYNEVWQTLYPELFEEYLNSDSRSALRKLRARTSSDSYRASSQLIPLSVHVRSVKNTGLKIVDGAYEYIGSGNVLREP